MKKLLLLAGILLQASTVSAISFDVDVGALTNSSVYGVEYAENRTIQEINGSIQNTGSIGCQFRLRGEFSYKNKTQKRYSDPYALYPGETVYGELHFIPENYTGEVRTELYVTYCGQEEKVTEFSFNSPRKLLPNRTIQNRVLEVTDSSTRIKLKIEDGRLIPTDAPPYWKTSSAKIRNGTAELKYDAPIFTHSEEITYTAVRNGEVVGETTVSLEEPDEPIENLLKDLPLILLTVSLAVNSGFLLQKLENRTK